MRRLRWHALGGLGTRRCENLQPRRHRPARGSATGRVPHDDRPLGASHMSWLSVGECLGSAAEDAVSTCMKCVSKHRR